MTLTPMMAQWQACKTQAKDALLFFRLGDFYEAFYDDAKIISQELHLTLTQRQSVPMCGVPYHAYEHYVDKLIAKGHKIAIAEQTEDPKTAKGLVKREISCIVTPGTIVNSQLLSDKKNNYIAAVSEIGSIFGLSCLDLTTGEFRAREIESAAALTDELHRVHPAEIVASSQFKNNHPSFFQDLSLSFSFLLNIREEWQFSLDAALKTLLGHLQVQSLKSFGLEDKIAAITAAGALLIYLKDDLALRLNHVRAIQNEAAAQYMAIDRSTLRHLEIMEPVNDGAKSSTLLDLLDHTATPMGGRQLRFWLQYPLLDIGEIGRRQDAIADFLAHPDAMKRLHPLLSRLRDIERLIAKTASRNASPRDLFLLGESLALLPAIRGELEPLPCSFLDVERKELHDVSAIQKQITESMNEAPPLRINEGGIFRSGVHPELDRLRLTNQESVGWVARYQSELREKTGIKTLKVGFTKAFGYYIEVSRAKGDNIPDWFQRSQTLVNAERFVTEELKQTEHRILSSDERANALEASLFEELRDKTAKEADTILAIGHAIARIDAALSLSLAAKEHRFCRPVVNQSDEIVIEKGRHPVVERAIGSAHFIPNDTHLGPGRQLVLLTGPNMAGKSTYIRQVALIAILAQTGSYVPAEAARIGLVDKVFSRIGAGDDLARGQSTFMVEMTETANILHNATPRSLILLDEIGRGTSTYDGISIAWAVAEYLLENPDKKAKTLFATHYWELTQLPEKHPAAVNMHVAVKENDDGILFLHQIVPGGTDRSYGIHVAKLAGLPAPVIRCAEEILAKLEEIREKKTGVPEKKTPGGQLPLFEPIT